MAVGERHLVSVGGGAAPGSAPVVALDLARREREAAFRRERSRAECSLFVWVVGAPRRRKSAGAGAKLVRLALVTPVRVGPPPIARARPHVVGPGPWRLHQKSEVPATHRDGAVQARPARRPHHRREGSAARLSDKRITPYVATRTCARVAAILTRAPEVCGTAPFWRRARVD